MKILVAVVGTGVQDEIQVGLEAIDGVEVECAEGLMALDRVRRCNYAAVFLGWQTGQDDSLARILEERPDLPFVVCAQDAVLRRVKQERVKVSAVLELPLDSVEFFKVVHRLLQRLSVAS